MPETIVAVYDTAAHAELAIRDLETAGVPSSAISHHAKSMTTDSAVALSEPHREKGFWAGLFGSEPEHDYDTSVYDRSVESGSTVVTVKAPEEHLTQVMEILERHNPVDIDERGASYATTQTTTAMGIAPPGMSGRVGATNDESIELAEESLAVGKRAINRGTTRVRRYVVETPVEEQVSLRDETVSIERRPVTDSHPITNADFTDKVIEMTETAEEAVVSKTARVTEEVLVHKDVTERTETVRDTLRKDEVEITKEPGIERTTATTAIPVIPERKV